MSEKLKKAAMGSWKTTLAGVAQFGVVLCTAIQHQFDGIPSTVPEWGLVASSAVVMVGMIFTRDNDKSSEESK